MDVGIHQHIMYMVHVLTLVSNPLYRGQLCSIHSIHTCRCTYISIERGSEEGGGGGRWEDREGLQEMQVQKDKV